VLQIGDFGFADFHSKDSRSLVHRSAVNGVTETYSAPEFDVTRQVSPQFDIWSFGCILLQFVVWYMYGWQGIENFSSERTKDSRILIFPSDNFYALEVSGTSGYKGRVKSSVMEVSIHTIWRNAHS
jgi:serine/threonine protein kinase